MPLNRGFSSREQVAVDSAGLTVLAYVAARHAHSSRDEWARRLDRGELELDGAAVPAEATLCAGQTLVWHRPPRDEAHVPMSDRVLHEDAAIVAVIKPRGLPTMPAGGFWRARW